MTKSLGFTVFVPSTITVVTMIASFGFLSLAMRTLPLGTAYTVWTGIGAVGEFAMGLIVLGETVSPMRLTAAALILAGIVLYNIIKHGWVSLHEKVTNLHIRSACSIEQIALGAARRCGMRRTNPSFASGAQWSASGPSRHANNWHREFCSSGVHELRARSRTADINAHGLARVRFPKTVDRFIFAL